MRQLRSAVKLNISFERVTQKDIDTFISLEKKVSGNKFYSPTLTKKEASDEIKNFSYFLKIGDKIVGSITYQNKEKGRAYISGLVVDPEYQGRGIAREALTHILAELKDKKRIDLVTHPENIRAVNLYLSFGFKIESRKENYFGDGEPRIILSLNR